MVLEEGDAAGDSRLMTVTFKSERDERNKQELLIFPTGNWTYLQATTVATDDQRQIHVEHSNSGICVG